MSTYGWTRSSFCAAGDCITAAWSLDGILLRDSKLGCSSPVQGWTFPEWHELLRAVRVAIREMWVEHPGVQIVMPLTEDRPYIIVGLPRHTVRLGFDFAEWTQFYAAVHRGEFDIEALKASSDQPEPQPAEATDGSPVAAGVDAATPAPAPNSPVINFRLLKELRDREHPLLRIVPEIVDTYHVGVGEVMHEARTAHHLFDMIDIPHGEGYEHDLDARAYLAIVKILNLRERLDRITTWHARETGPAGMVGDFCIRCGDLWPCDTHRMASGSYIDEEDAPAPNSPAGRLSDQPSSGGAERVDQPGPVGATEWWAEPNHQEFINELLTNTPESWDYDAAAEGIVIDYLHELERRVKVLGGTLERFEDDELEDGAQR